MRAMPKLKKLVVDQGINFTNAFIATPVCCPSRSSYISGLYQHNHKCLSNSVGTGCNSQGWVKGPERQSPAVYLQSAGYATFYAGKYLNDYGVPGSGGDLSHVPPGWSSWLGLQV